MQKSPSTPFWQFARRQLPNPPLRERGGGGGGGGGAKPMQLTWLVKQKRSFIDSVELTTEVRPIINVKWF